MKKLLVLVLITVVIGAFQAFGIPAYPKRVPIIVDGDTLYLQIKGDEHNKYAMDKDGLALLQTENGWYYATMEKDGRTIPSEFKLTAESKRSRALKNFLETKSQNIKPSLGNVHNMPDKINVISNTPVIGQRRVLVIMMQFRDKLFTKKPDDFKRLFNENNYQEDGAIGSVRDYYNYVSYNQLDLQCDIMGPYTSMQNMAFYGSNTTAGGNDQNPYVLFEEAIENVVKEINLSDYDADGDGYVDNVHIIYAGYGEEAGASSNAIWAHEMTFSAITIQGMKINKYSCAPELRGNMGNGISRIGPHCHEIGHALGAMDYYDTNYETDGSYQGTGQWDVMASGSWNNDGICPANFNPYVKVYNFGWAEAKSLQTDAENTIIPYSVKGDIYRLDTGHDNDFYLIENRQQEYFDKAVPGTGLLIYHIGPDIKEKSLSNTINSTHPQQCYPVCAGAKVSRPSSQVQSYGNINSSECPYPGSSQNVLFSDSSIPAALTFNGKKTGINLNNIRIENDNVLLYYGSTGNIPPDIPDDPDIPVNEENVVWREDFENVALSSFWRYEDITGSGVLDIYKKMMGHDTPKSPNAANGQGMAVFTPIVSNMVDVPMASGRLISNIINLNAENQHTLSLAVRKYAVTSNKYDSLHIVIQTDKEIKAQHTALCQQEAWETISIPIPDETASCRVNIIFGAAYHSIIFLDDIKIMSSSTTSAKIKTMCKNAGISSTVYDLYGRKIIKGALGLKIVRMNNGQVKKIYVK